MYSQKLQRVCPISGLAVEGVRFDTQKLQNPEVDKVQYQQGTLFGYEVREYLLLKWEHQCAYCDAKNVRLEIDHMVPVAAGGSDAVSNLCIACRPCNQKKAARSLKDFLKHAPDRLAKLLAQAKAPLKDAAAVNSTRKALIASLVAATGLPLTEGTGGRTKFNRTRQGYRKAHWIDAACVGDTGERVDLSRVRTVTLMKAKGRGSRQMCKTNQYGFPSGDAKKVKRLHGFQTGDRVRLVQPSGKYEGTHEGVVSIRANGRFDIQTGNGKITASYTRFTRLARFDGYTYAHQKVVGVAA